MRVRWSEVDPQGVVFNGHYMTYADTAVTEYWRALALPYQRIPALFGGELFVRHAELSYRASAYYDDWLEVYVRGARIGRTSLAISCRIKAQSQYVVDVNLVYVLADPQVKQALEIPPMFREWINAFESGAAMTQTRLGSWDELRADAAQLRSMVFIEEQGVPADQEWDSDDATALHAVVYNRAAQAIATARLIQAPLGVAKIGRMAVDISLRGGGVGRDLLLAMLAQAKQRGNQRVVLHAQVTARGFYERYGFEAEGPEFDEAGLAHVLMSKTL